MNTKVILCWLVCAFILGSASVAYRVSASCIGVLPKPNGTLACNDFGVLYITKYACRATLASSNELASTDDVKIRAMDGSQEILAGGGGNY